MKPVFQTKFGYPFGNCYAACVASVLECGLDDVPEATEPEVESQNYRSWYDRVNSWVLHEHGQLLIWCSGDYSHGHVPLGLHILSAGCRPSGLPHAVLADGTGQIVHNPQGASAPTDWSWIECVYGFEIFVPVRLISKTPWRDLSDWRSG